MNARGWVLMVLGLAVGVPMVARVIGDVQDDEGLLKIGLGLLGVVLGLALFLAGYRLRRQERLNV